MGIRIQPREIDVPEADPFKNDLLSRKKPAEVLTHLVGALEGPCVLAVDAAWGAGKTTFLNIWSKHLRNQKFPVVKFNAWETDHAGDPFVALSSELTEGLREYEGTDKGLAEKISNAAMKVLHRAVPSVIRLATASIPDVGPLVEKEAGQFLASLAEKRLSGYQAAQQSVEEFRRVLQDMADTLSKSKENRPLIVVIDELDRCRPLYAVELLETAKHLFAVNNIIFVLAVNRTELAHSIKALYGSGFDAEGYLGRFFDLDFRLPAPERKAFINTLLEATQINDYFGQMQDQTDVQVARALLLGFFGMPTLSLRTIAQALHRLGLVLASLPSDRLAFALQAVVALILRTVNPDLYHRFVQGTNSDLQVVNKMLDRPELTNLKGESPGLWFEAIIILAAGEVTDRPISSDRTTWTSPLLQQYQELVAADASDTAAQSPERAHAQGVLERVEWFTRGRAGIGFKHSVQRLELLSNRSHPPGPRVIISFAMYCTHCGHTGKPKRITKGTMGTELLLLLLGILPGILYGVWRLTSRYEGCPRCLAPHMIPKYSPRAQQRLG